MTDIIDIDKMLSVPKGAVSEEVEQLTQRTDDLGRAFKGAFAQWQFFETMITSVSKFTSAIDSSCSHFEKLTQLAGNEAQAWSYYDALITAANDARVPVETLIEALWELQRAGDAAFSTANFAQTVSFITTYLKAARISDPGLDSLDNAAATIVETLGQGDGILDQQELEKLLAGAPVLENVLGELPRSMATADFVDQVLAGNEQIDRSFDETAIRFNELGNTILNTLQQALMPAMLTFAELAQNPAFQNFLALICQGIAQIGNVLLDVATLFVEHADIMIPLLAGIVGGIMAWQLMTAILRMQLFFATVQQTLFNTALGLCPLIMLISLIMAVVTAIMYLWKFNDKFRNALLDAWKKIIGWMEKGVNGLIDIINKVRSAINDIFGTDLKMVKHVNMVETTEAVYQAKGWRDSHVGQVDNDTQRLIDQAVQLGGSPNVNVQTPAQSVNVNFNGDINSETDLNKMLQNLTDSLQISVATGANYVP